jgi:hypothetical protein
MKLDVPYLSQHLDVNEEEWRNRACTPTCLKMVMDFYWGDEAQETLVLDDLIKEGNEIGGHNDVFGWIHDYIVILAHNHGFRAYKEEFKSRDPVYNGRLAEMGIVKIKQQLAAERPVMVSAVKKFKETGKYHTVLLTGFEEENGKLTGFYYHDPDAETVKEGKDQFVTLSVFIEHWRRLCIFVY